VGFGEAAFAQAILARVVGLVFPIGGKLVHWWLGVMAH
jgi:hypothetical protein